MDKNKSEQQNIDDKPTITKGKNFKKELFDILKTVIIAVIVAFFWGVTTAVGMFHSRWPAGRGSGSVTSRPAPARRPLSRASQRASVSTINPRPTFKSTAPSFILARRSRSIKPRVASVPGRVTATTSAWGSS